MNKQQTAVERLAKELIKYYNLNSTMTKAEIIEQANAKFEQQIKDAFEKGGLDGWNLTSAEYYYNETYNTNHE
jgi:hypothetical protein